MSHPTNAPPPYVNALLPSTPPPYTPQSSITAQPFFYPVQAYGAPTFQLLYPATTTNFQALPQSPPQVFFFTPVTHNSSIFFFQLLLGNYASRTFHAAPPFPPFVPGQVPCCVPRETRYEMQRGILTPVEHFAGPATPLPSRGWNTMHAYDTGPPPPFTTGGIAQADLAQSQGHTIPSSATGRSTEDEAAGARVAGSQVLGEGAQGSRATAGEGDSESAERLSAEPEIHRMSVRIREEDPDENSAVEDGASRIRIRIRNRGRVSRSQMDRNLAEAEATRQA